MRWAMQSSGIGLLALASCASPAVTPVASMMKNPDHAIVLTERPVPSGGTEYVVRTDDGATMAVVQPTTPELRQFLGSVLGDDQKGV